MSELEEYVKLRLDRAIEDGSLLRMNPMLRNLVTIRNDEYLGRPYTQSKAVHLPSVPICKELSMDEHGDFCLDQKADIYDVSEMD